MKTFVVIAVLIALAGAYPEDETTKNKRGVFGGFGFGHAPLLAAPAPFVHAPLYAPAPVFTKTVLPAPVITKTVLPAPVITKTVLPAPVFTKTVLPAAPLVAHGLGHASFGLGHGFGGHYW